MKTFIQFLNEAEYKGKNVTLEVPFKLDDDPDYTHGVYVKGDDAKVKFIRFGSHDKLRMKSMNCDDPGPRTGAKFWACRMQPKGATGE